MLVRELFLLITLVFRHALSDKNVGPPTTLSVRIDDLSFNVSWAADFDLQVVNFVISLSHELKDELLIVGFTDNGDIENQNSDFCGVYQNKIVDGYINTKGEIKFDIGQDCLVPKKLPKDPERYGFSRKFVTCDPLDYAIEPGTTNFIFARVPLGIWKIDNPKIRLATRHNMLLKHPVPPIPAPSPETRILEIRAKKAHVPAAETTYWCAIAKLDTALQRAKHHIISLEPVITKNNEHLVHHMEIFHCEGNIDGLKEYNGNCNSPSKPSAARVCSKVIAAWAMGADTFFYPAEAGMPVGGPGYTPYVMVEVHYNNPNKIPGIVDESGFRIHYTPNLRPHDAGIMELGLIYSEANSIPPNSGPFPISGYCMPECTAHFPENGITIFGSQLHAHLYGKRLVTSHYRKGVKIGEVNRDNHFSRHWQHIQMLHEPVKVLPGDALVTTCLYDNPGKNFVFGGYEISNEMCVNYVYYYPASEVEVCKSAISNKTLNRFFANKGIKNLNEKVHAEKYKELESRWSPLLTRELQGYYATGPLNMACLGHDGFLVNNSTRWGHLSHHRTFAGSYTKDRDRYECPALNAY